LVQQKLEVVVVRPDGEWSAPEIKPPMSHGEDQANEFMLIHCERCMAGSECLLKNTSGPCP
jgi:hypothetical protein